MLDQRFPTFPAQWGWQGGWFCVRAFTNAASHARMLIQHFCALFLNGLRPSTRPQTGLRTLVLDNAICLQLKCIYGSYLVFIVHYKQFNKNFIMHKNSTEQQTLKGYRSIKLQYERKEIISSFCTIDLPQVKWCTVHVL